MPSANKQRILALWFPWLPAERLLRRRHGRSWRSRLPPTQAPLAFSCQQNNTQRVVALDARAAALGLRTGLGVAEARAMHPSLEVVDADPQSDRRLLDALADWCDRYTPLVALDGADSLFLDISGCAHLFGGEQPMLDDALARFAAQGLSVRGAIASTPGAAWAAAHYGAAEAAVIAPGAEAGLMTPLPLAALRLDASVCAGLESVGLRLAGALLDIPRAPLVRRFGRSVVLRIDQALGHVEEAISPRLPVPQLMMERNFFEPIGLLDDIEALLALMTRQLRVELERCGKGAERLQLQLFRVDGTVARIDIAASQPLRDPRSICRLFHEKLAASASDLDPGFGFDLVRLAVLSAAPFAEDQASLEAKGTDRRGDLAMFADRVRMRLGDEAVARPLLVESHLPERAAIVRPFTEWRRPLAAPSGERQRPIRLFDRPEPVDITVAEAPEGPPSHFRWRQVSYRVAAAEGPERVSHEWWMAAAPEDADEPEGHAASDANARATRDYFRVEDETGRRYWLYRQGFYGDAATPPRWYMHGLFA